MDRSEARWAGIIIFMMLLAYFVPYVLLRNVDAWYGSFLFWSVFAIFIIFVNALITVNWRD